MAAAQAVSPREMLCEAPRSLRSLSLEHGDGWGMAVHTGDDWRIERSTSCAARCERFGELVGIETRLAIAHVRKATVGARTLANTHPFRRGRFAFAHNGTVRDVAALVARTAPEHLAALEGETDSERLFAFVLTHVDAAGDVERGVASAVHALHALGDVGSASFLVSCGARLYAHRLGRTLYTTTRGDVAMVASEPPFGEPWQEVPEGGLVIVEVARTTLLAA
jgi:predicted glutamine amidotransferase